MTKNTRIRFLFLGITLLCVGTYTVMYDYSYEHADQSREQIAGTSRNEQTNTNSMTKDDPEAADTVQTNQKLLTKPMFLLKELDGYVTVFLADGETLYTTTDILPEDLETDTRQQLQDGIMIYSINELYEWLESYST